jgi:Cytochrome P450
MSTDTGSKRLASAWISRSYLEAVLRGMHEPGALYLSGYYEVQEVLRDVKRFTRLPPAGYRHDKRLRDLNNWAVFRYDETHEALRDLLLSCLGEIEEAIGPIFDRKVRTAVAAHVGTTAINACEALANDLTRQFIEMTCGISARNVIELERASKVIDISGARASVSDVADAVSLFQRAARRSPLVEIATRKAKLAVLPLDENVIAQNVGMLIYAFFGPLPALLANVVLAVSQHPEQNQAAVSDPRGWLHECLRLYSPTAAVDRIATEDIRVVGTDIRRGQMVRCLVANANRDNSIFNDPHTFKVERKSLSRHLSFGRGVHSCVGVPLTETLALALVRNLMLCTGGVELLNSTIEWSTFINATAPKSLIVRLLAPLDCSTK